MDSFADVAIRKELEDIYKYIYICIYICLLYTSDAADD